MLSRARIALRRLLSGRSVEQRLSQSWNPPAAWRSAPVDGRLRFFHARWQPLAAARKLEVGVGENAPSTSSREAGLIVGEGADSPSDGRATLTTRYGAGRRGCGPSSSRPRNRPSTPPEPPRLAQPARFARGACDRRFHPRPRDFRRDRKKRILCPGHFVRVCTANAQRALRAVASALA